MHLPANSAHGYPLRSTYSRAHQPKCLGTKPMPCTTSQATKYQALQCLHRKGSAFLAQLVPCIGHRQQVCRSHGCTTLACTLSPETQRHNSKYIKKCIQTSCLQLGGLPWKPLTCCAFQVSMPGMTRRADTLCSMSFIAVLS